MRRNLARGAFVGLGGIALAAACSKADPTATQSQPAATASASSPATPPVFPAEPTTAPSAPVVVAPAEEPAPGPQSKPATPHAAPPAKTLARPSPTATPVPRANKPQPKADDDGLHATPAPSLGMKKVAVLANNHYTCSSTEKRDNVAAFAEPRGARIAIVGQGPCPGEVHDWSAQVSQQRVEVHGTHGAASKCKCVGTGELVLRGLEPGTYDIAVNGGFDRPIATRITVLQ